MAAPGGDPWRERGLRDAALSGDRLAWRELFEAHAASLEAFVGWRCAGCRELTEDAIQETWLVAVDRLAAFDPCKGAFANWLSGIAANAIRNLLRRRRVKRQLLPPDFAAPRRDPERVALTLAELPARYEEVLRFKYLDGLTIEEIAVTTGQTAKAIESLLSRARQAFRDAYLAEE